MSLEDQPDGQIALEQALKKAAESLQAELSSKEWIETLVITARKRPVVDDAQDDLKREVAFYDATLDGVQQALAKFEAMNFRWRRPDGSRPDEPPFLAEMVKTDAHMAKVKERLLQEQKKIAEAEERKHQRQMRKFGKQVQVQKKQERDKQKREDMEKIKKWREGKGSAAEVLGEGSDADEAGPASAAAGMDKKSLVGKRKRDGDTAPATKDSAPKRNKKREAKDRKYGFGGKKRWIKSNTRETAADMEGFHPKKMKRSAFGAPNASKGRAGGRAKAPRPGKQRRHQQHKGR